MTQIRIFLLLVLCLIISAPAAQAEIESTLIQTVQLKNKPIDIEISLSGQSFYVLDNRGQLLIYDNSGELKDTLDVGKDVDQIKVSPRDDYLFLSSSKKKTIQVLSLSVVQEINTKGSPFKGPEDAPVVMAVFSDFQCPYCARIGSILDKVLEKHPKKVKLVYKYFPLPNHRYAFKAAQAAEAAHQQGKFWEYHDLIYKNFSSLNDTKFEEFRDTLKLDKEKFDKAMNAAETKAKINTDKNEGSSAEVRGTPTVFVNGRMVRPARPENIEEAIEKALKEKK